jgi:hypothetical protein
MVSPAATFADRLDELPSQMSAGVASMPVGKEGRARLAENDQENGENGKPSRSIMSPLNVAVIEPMAPVILNA